MSDNQLVYKKQVERNYCHLTITLPTKTPFHREAAREVIDVLRKNYTGTTYIDTGVTNYTGTWFNKQNQMVVEPVTIFMVDIAMDFSYQKEKLRDELNMLKRIVFEAYYESRVAQDEVWITASPLWLLMNEEDKKSKNLN